jgi:hypothetical protein
MNKLIGNVESICTDREITDPVVLEIMESFCDELDVMPPENYPI